MQELRAARRHTAGVFHAAHTAGRVDEVIACYAFDATLEEVAAGRRHQGHAALRTGLERFFELFEDRHFVPGPQISAGDSLMCPYTLNATLSRDLGPLRLSGRRVSLHGAHVLEFRDTQILHCRDFWDFDELAAQAA